MWKIICFSLLFSIGYGGLIYVLACLMQSIDQGRKK